MPIVTVLRTQAQHIAVQQIGIEGPACAGLYVGDEHRDTGLPLGFAPGRDGRLSKISKWSTWCVRRQNVLPMKIKR